MKVCHLTSVHPARDIRIFIKECQTLANNGHEVRLLVANQVVEEGGCVEIESVNFSRGGRLSRMLRAPFYMYKRANQLGADVYHFHDPELLLIGLFLKWKGYSVIYDVHEDVPEQILSKEWIPKWIRVPVSKVATLLEKFVSRRIDAVITATPHIAKRFSTYNTRTTTVHNYPLKEELSSSNSTSVNQDRYRIAYVGAITELRGIKEMVEAISKVNKDVTLVLGGAFQPESLLEEVKQLPGWSRVDYRGLLNREEVRDVYREANLGLVLLQPIPRYEVSYPIKLFEYMSAELPVLTSNFSLWTEIIEQWNCGHSVNPKDTQSIASEMEWFMNHPEEALEMGRRGRQAILEKYNWEAESKVLLQLYEEIQRCKV